MKKSFDQGKDEIAKLCRYFAANRQAFLAPGVKEAHVRQSLIDPLFEALGWDVRNADMVAPQYREVVPEDSLEIEGQQKAPDYTFRVGSQPRFYAEAKKCGVNINADPGPAFQLRRYGWSAKVVLSLLTDFEELGAYDCTIRPRIGDKASYARIHYFRSEEYPDRWRELWDVFSREAVWSGLFDQYAASKRKRGTSEVDSEFLKEIEGWRDALARNIALRNADISLDDLNAAVQVTIDRIVFLRMAEDRGIEPYKQLSRLCEQPDIYARFMRETCRKADEKYNSGLFHFQKETGVLESPDRITPNLAIDDKVLKPILQGLYFEFGSPYHFGVMPVEILGTVYERFLGKVIRLTDGHQAKIEEKPEVRKAGGVYYTPSYIVDYIVKNTVDKLIKGRSPAELGGGKGKPPFRVLDMACGSGSFLLGAYQHLLDHALSWYQSNKPETHKTAVSLDPRSGHWRLTIEEKKRILTTHIFGVDIDPQAVEVSKLSLSLKVLEGETDQTFGEQMRIFQERALPSLADNIKCGNSLIGPDYFLDKLIPDPEELRRINPFDWNRAFPEAMKAGGFDCVIGNPPYVDIKSLTEHDVQYIFQLFISANNRINLFAAFMEKAITLLKINDFCFSMIVPNVILTQQSYKDLRKLILSKSQIRNIVRLPNESFGNAAGDVKVDTVILVLGDRSPQKMVTEIISYEGYKRIQQIDPTAASVHEKVDTSSWQTDPENVWSIASSRADNRILKKCEQKSVVLDECADFSLGLTPYDKYKGHTPSQINSRVFHAKRKINKTYGRLLAGNDVMRYSIKWNGEQWISYGPWLGAPREKRFFVEKRILVKQIIDWSSKRIWASITDEELFNTQNAFNLIARKGWNLEFLLGILNSRLISFYHRKKYLDEYKMRFQKILIKDCRRFPVRAINPDINSEVVLQDRMVKLVNAILALNKRLAEVDSTEQVSIIRRQIDAADSEIDRLVYELYGLTKDEIKIVEGES